MDIQSLGMFLPCNTEIMRMSTTVLLLPLHLLFPLRHHLCICRVAGLEPPTSTKINVSRIESANPFSGVELYTPFGYTLGHEKGSDSVSVGSGYHSN